MVRSIWLAPHARGSDAARCFPPPDKTVTTTRSVWSRAKNSEAQRWLLVDMKAEWAMVFDGD